MKSMTAYGRASRMTSFGSWVVEIHSVNRKMLDLHIYLPRELLSLDIPIRKYLAESIHRGQVTVRITPQREDKTSAAATSCILEPLKTLKSSWDSAAKELGYDPDRVVTLEFLVSQLNHSTIPIVADPSNIEKELLQILDEALKGFHEMRTREGSILERDIVERCRMIKDSLRTMKTCSEDSVAVYKDKLTEKLKEAAVDGLDERLAKEVVLFADRIDITEELTRLKSHLEQFDDTLKTSSPKGIGRTLDFLVQEMGREINTIASKSNDMEISKEFVITKSELEKIREQIQNIE